MGQSKKGAAARILVLAVIICMLASMLTFTASAETLSGTFGPTNNLTWSFNTDTGVLSISGTGAMPDVYSTPWYAYRYGLIAAEISNGVTTIGNNVFGDLDRLASITIPNSVTSIGSWAFYGCGSLTSITIPSSVTSIGEGAFSSCGSLTSITIPNSVTSIGNGAFRGCRSLSSITIPNGVTSIGENMFSQCTSLTSITIPNGVTSIGRSAFWECTSLTSITIPNGVTSIGTYAFLHCTSLTSISVPSSVTSIGVAAFEFCESLTSITIPNNVTSIERGTFARCTSLTSITIPNGVTRIGEYAFNGCTSLTNITIPNSVTSIGDGVFWDCTSLTSITIPNSVTSIGEYMFYDCRSLTSITIPDSVTSIGMWAFSGCRELSKIVFNGYVAPTVSSNSAFSGIASGASVYVRSTAIRFPAEGQLWNGLIVRYTDTPSPITITWNYNGGTGSPATSSLTTGNVIGTLPTPNARTGYTFNGWYTATTGGTQITASSTVPNSNVTYYAQWTASTSTITASPAAPSFGSLAVGYTQPSAQTITITNSGTANVTLSALTSVSNWTLTQNSNWTTAMAPGQTRTFTIRPISGLAAGTYNPTITISGSGGASAQIQPTFTVTAPTTSAITASPAAPSFGSLAVGYTQPSAQTITVTNSGTTNVTLNALPSVSNWTLTQASNWTTAMSPGQTRTFTIRPNSGLAAGTYNPTITISGSGGASVQIQPTFTVTAATTSAITVSPAAPSFGSLAVGYSQPSAQTITITNSGTANVTLNALPSVSNWTLTQGSNWTTAMSPGQTRTFTIRPNSGLAAGTYNPTITISGSGGASAQIQPTFTVTAASGTAPAITTHPANRSTTEGQTVSFTAAASGNPTPTAQWEYSRDNGATWSGIIDTASGATSATFMLSNVQLSQNGYRYRCVFTNSHGTATTNIATLTVTAGLSAPAITTHPANQTAPAGQSATFTIASGGNPTPTYQWQQSTNSGTSWSNLSGQTSATLTLSNVQSSQNGYRYRCIVTNSQGTVTSNAATLTVNTAFIDPYTFTAATYGYSARSWADLRLSNTSSNHNTSTYSIVLSGTHANFFMLSTDTIEGIPAGESRNFGVRPVTGLDAGNYTATATVTTASGNALSFNVHFTVNKANQTLSASNISRTVGSGSVNLNTHATSTAGEQSGAVSYAVTSAGTTGASISGTTLSFTSAGTATITASAAGSNNYNSASTTFTLTVTAANSPTVRSMSNFTKIRTYNRGQFRDVNEDLWYGYNNQKVVASAYEYGLMQGDSANTFNPTGNMTIAEAITVAARVHSIYSTGTEDFVQGSVWYQVYVDYAVSNGIIRFDIFSSYTRRASRAEMAYIFSRALPEAEFASQNTVNSLPDVNSGTTYRGAILMLYRAGVLTGNDAQGTFNPGSNITRAEAAAIISRVILPETRESGNSFG